MTVLLYAILIILTTSSAQILLKKSALNRCNRKKSLQLLCFGYCIFFLTVLVSYALMKQIEMKYFTVIMSLNYIAVMLGARMFLGEALNRKKMIGTLLIACGIIIFTIRP